MQASARVFGVELEPDPRMTSFIGGFDEGGEPLPFTLAGLQETADSWPIHPSTPEGVAGQLAVSRQLFVHSFFAYEFATVAVAWSLFGVEGALRVGLSAPERATLAQLVQRGLREGLLPGRYAGQLEAARELRNAFSHATSQSVWSYGMTAPALQTSHDVVAHISAQSGSD